ncbi:MAG: UDP-3-O-(3-hydroxymyristoyl)glucosamine N-acyltransferase [Sedimentisphaerales bacterium]|nr:UDP-3-O-(3-hydroxymyristoyl)glucosamine N-acyltransferase [Sedimentisphaerales bacterium]
MPKQFKLSDIATHIDARLTGQSDVVIKHIAALQDAGDNDISFVSDLRYAGLLAQTRAAAVIVPQDFDKTADTPLLYVNNVYDALDRLTPLFAPDPDTPKPGIHTSADIHPSAQIHETSALGAHVTVGANAVIGAGTIICPGCVIAQGVHIGNNCFLWPNVVINQNCIVGHNVIINANTTIGTDGFGYRLVEGRHRKIQHIGNVVIEDDVEIGANCCIDRAKFSQTVVGRGTKIDNLVQIAHNVKIGQNCIIAGQAGIAGSSTLGNYVVLAGQSAVGDHVRVGDGVMLGPMAGISSNQEIPPGEKMIGAPARPFRAFYRELSFIQKLPELAREIKQLRKRIETLESAKNHS